MKSCKLSVLVTLLLVAVALKAQDDPLEGGWKYTVGENFASMTNQKVNSGSLSVFELRLTQHLEARGNYLAMGTPEQAGLFVGPQPFASLGHIKQLKAAWIDASKFEVFGNALVGAQRGGTQSAPFKFSFMAGGGLRYLAGKGVEFRPFEVSYVHSPGFRGLIGNHMEFAAGLGMRFGKR